MGIIMLLPHHLHQRQPHHQIKKNGIIVLHVEGLESANLAVVQEKVLQKMGNAMYVISQVMVNV